MKKTFIILITFVYLVTGIGFRSMQCYCQHMQKLESHNESQSCCTDSIKEPSTACQMPGMSDLKDCCSESDALSLPATDTETILPDDCCNVRPQYTQLDRSALPLNFDVNHVAKSICVLYSYPHHIQSIDGCALVTFEALCTQVNIPLLI